MDGQALEGVFKKVKLDCASMKDPAFQLALILHNQQNANEVFLLSLRDCLGALPEGHPVRRWYNRKSVIDQNFALGPILQALQGDLKDVWTSDENPTAKQREAIMRMVDVLEEWPAYLDLTLLQAVGYQKLGNWARAELLLRQWLALSPVQRLEKTPARRDALGLYMRDNAGTFFEALIKGGKERFIIQMFFRGVIEFISDPRVTDQVEKYVDADAEEVLTKLNLHYHRSQAPTFADWYLNRYLEGKRRERFLDNFFADPASKERYWIFISRLPDLPQHRDELAKLLLGAKKVHDPIFYVMATEEPLRAALTKSSPDSVKNLIKERRQFFMSSYASNRDDMLSLSQLVEMGQVDEELVKSVVKNGEP